MIGHKGEQDATKLFEGGEESHGAKSRGVKLLEMNESIYHTSDNSL